MNQPVKHVKANAKSKARLTVFDIAEPCPTGGNAVLGAKKKKGYRYVEESVLRVCIATSLDL